MTIESNAYAFLRCTVCSGHLAIKTTVDTGYPWGPIESGLLVCQQCGEKFKIDNYVPDLLPDGLRSFVTGWNLAFKRNAFEKRDRLIALEWLEHALDLQPATLGSSRSQLARELAAAQKVQSDLGLSESDFRQAVGVLASHLMAAGYRRHVADQLRGSLQAVNHEKYEDIILRKLMNSCLSNGKDVVLVELGSGVGRVLHQYASCVIDDRDAATAYRRSGPQSLYRPDSLVNRSRLRLILGVDFERTMLSFASRWFKADKLDDLVEAGRLMQVRGAIRQTQISFTGTPFDRATRVVCILFQTLGNQIGSDLQIDMLQKACEIARPNGIVIVSVFNAAAFEDQADPYYGSIKGSVGDALLWGKDFFLSKRGVYSRWFSTSRFRSLFHEAGITDAAVLDSGTLQVFPEFAGYLPMHDQRFFRQRALVGVVHVGEADTFTEALAKIGGPNAHLLA